MSSLNDKVYGLVKNIPRGKVATYGQIALHLGNRNFARAVGNILHKNPDPEHIPCHRVVNAQNDLTISISTKNSMCQQPCFIRIFFGIDK